MDKVKGSMEALSAMQLAADMEGLDTQSKMLLHSKEVLAVILQGSEKHPKITVHNDEIYDLIQKIMLHFHN